LPYEEDWRKQWVDYEQKPIAQQAIEATANARATLMGGFTTVRDVGSTDLMDVGLRNAIDEGAAVGPRMKVSVAAIGATGGHCDNTGARPGVYLHETSDGVADSPDEARRKVRWAIKYGADVIKICATGGVLSIADEVDTPQMTQAELDAVMD